jgi:hypothetical protein
MHSAGDNFMCARLSRVLGLALIFCSVSLFAQQIRGDYVETRSADVYTGQCFANGEVNVAGREAILAWHVQSGAWNGIPLDGLTVAAAVRAKGTLGDPYENPYPAQAVLVIDEQANSQQRAALTAFAKQMGGELLNNVEQVIPAPVEFIVKQQQHGMAMLRAGQFVTVSTRAVGEHDHVCGNEVTFYPPLTQTAHAMPAVAMTDSYHGPGLGTEWESHGRRSAFVGTFVR